MQNVPQPCTLYYLGQVPDLAGTLDGQIFQLSK